MNIRKVFKYLLIGAIIGVAVGIGVAFAELVLDMEIEISYVIAAIVTVTIIIVMVIFYRMLNPLYIVKKGYYDQAIEKLNKLIKRYDDNAAVKNPLLYNIACILNRKGDLEESINYLRKIDLEALNKYIRSAYFALYAVNLMLLERDIEIAEEYINESYNLVKNPYCLLYKCYLVLLKGDIENADVLMEEYQNLEDITNKRYGFGTMAIIDKAIANIEKSFYMGVYYLKKKKSKLAEQYLSAASQSEFSNYYSDTAKKLLEENTI